MTTPLYDVVVFGATSFVGQILCEYLTQTYGTDGELKWAAAGRSQSKLDTVKAALGKAASDLPLIIADANDQASLLRMCEQTRVVVSTVGPYALYGEPTVKACVESGTDYCDLTGETQWIARMLNAYEDRAKKTGARIVHCCGFDSIPSDLGVYFLQNESKKSYGLPCTRVKMRVKAAKGGFSGGTALSLMNVVKEASENPELRKELANPYSICPDNHSFSERQPNVKSAKYDEDFNAWSAPFVMAAINTRVVHRSNALSGNSYGTNFQYDEAMLTGQGLKGRVRALGLTGGLGGFLLGASIKPSRWVLENYVMPKAGEGPSKKEQQEGFYDIRFIGETEKNQQIKVKVYGDQDPGYGSTAKMLGQAAVCLAKDVAKEETPGGFWTPSTAMGEKLLSRLEEHAGLTFVRM